MQLHETMLGQKVFKHDLPEIHRQLSRVADALEKLANIQLQQQLRRARADQDVESLDPQQQENKN